MANPLPNPAPAPAPAAAPAQQIRHLRKGDLLFTEGEKSRAMFLVKAGSLRLFLKRGDSDVEVATIKPGEIVGELAFLDGNPRSVSGEALTDLDVVEISVPMFVEGLKKSPEWLKLLLKTIVGRLRAANGRIRKLETANTAVDYTSKDGGKRSTFYQYISLTEFLKVAYSLLLVGTRNGKPGPKGVEIDPGLVQHQANLIMGIPVAKVMTVVEILVEAQLATTEPDPSGNDRVYLKDVAFLEPMIAFIMGEEELDPEHRRNVSARGLIILGYVVANLENYKPDPRTGLTKINLGEVRHWESRNMQGEAFRDEELAELVQLGYFSDLKIQGSHEIFTSIKAAELVQSYRCMMVIAAIRHLNDQKKQYAGISK